MMQTFNFYADGAMARNQIIFDLILFMTQGPQKCAEGISKHGAGTEKFLSDTGL